MSRPQPRVFVSHATPDLVRINELIVPELAAASLEPYLAPREILGGDVWMDELIHHLSSCDLFLVVVSADVLDQKRHVRAEVMGWFNDHPDLSDVAVVRFDDTDCGILHIRLREIQSVNLSGTDPDLGGLRLTLAKRRDRVLGLTTLGRADDPGLEPVRDAYLRWVAVTHATTDALIAGVAVRADLVEAPTPKRLVWDGSTQFERAQEVEHHRTQAEGGRPSGAPASSHAGTDPGAPTDAMASTIAMFRAVAKQPLPTYLSHAQHIDALDLARGVADDATSLLARAWRCVILGDPGSGKSTLARRIAHDAAVAAAGGPSDDRTNVHLNRLPVLCRAADLAKVAIGGADDIGSDSTQQTPEIEAVEVLAAAITAGWMGNRPFDPLSGDPLSDAQLRRLVGQEAGSGRLLLMVDGLDEVPTLEERLRVARMVKAVGAMGGERLGTPAASPGVQVVATSRIAGYHLSPVGEGFGQHLVGPLTPSDALEVGEYWIRAHGRVIGAASTTVDASVVDLGALLSDKSTGSEDIAGNPFLVTSLASAVISGLTGRLRSAEGRWLRSDLFDAIVADALGRVAAAAPDVSPELVLDLQLATAFTMHSEERTGIVDETRLLEIVDRARVDLGADANDLDAEEARRLVHALGLLREEGRGQGLFGFLHLTVEEYLAGRWLLGPRSPLARLTSCAGDPRWVEPVALALGHLGRNDADLLERALGALLDPEIGEQGAVLVSRCLKELLTLRSHHIGALVGAAVLMGRDTAADTGADRAGSGATILRPLFAHGIRVDGRPAREVLGEILRGRLEDPDPQVMASAAALLGTLGFQDGTTARALAAVQVRDSPQLGWSVVRTLQAIQSRLHEGAAVDEDAARHAAERLDADTLAALQTITPHAAAVVRRGAPRRSGLASKTVPFREPFLEAAVRKHVLSDVRLVRLVFCLYGGLPFADRRHLEAEHLRLSMVRDAADQSWEARWSAAVRLDVHVQPRLQVPSGGRDLALDANLMTGGSPVTGVLVEQLRSRVLVPEILGLLWSVAQDQNASAEARGDALAGVLVSGAEFLPAWRAVVGSLTGDAVLDRVRWRLGRTALLTDDAIRRIDPGRMVDRLAEARGEPGLPIQTIAPVLRGVAALHPPGLPRSLSGEPDGLIAALLNASASNREDQLYNVAVMLDTRGLAFSRDDGDHLVASLADVDGHLIHLAPLLSDMWEADPLGPADADRIGEALTTVAGFAARWLHLRLWCLDRLASRLAAAGYGLEALLLAADALPNDSAGAAATASRILNASAPAASAAPIGGHPLAWLGNLDAIAEVLLDTVTDPYVVGRGRVTLAWARGRAMTGARLRELVDGLPTPGKRLRLLERAWDLEVAPGTADLVAAAVGWAGEIDHPDERMRAWGRLLRRVPRDSAIMEALRRDAAETAEVDPIVCADILGQVRAEGWVTAPDLLPIIELLPTSALRARARGELGEPLLELELAPAWEAREVPPIEVDQGAHAAGGLGEPASSVPEGCTLDWAVLSTSALCHDGLETLSRESTVDHLWLRLTDPEQRADACTLLLAAGDRRPLHLGSSAIGAIDQVVAEGDPQAAAIVIEILSVCTTSSMGPAIERWRTASDERLADLGSLLAIETGRMGQADALAVGRLLADADDRIRLRTTHALCRWTRGWSGAPRFRLTAIGPAPVAALARLAAPGSTRDLVVDTVLWWTLGDLIVDSVDVLRSALEELASEPLARRRLLQGLRQVRVEAMDDLLALVDELDETDGTALLMSFTAIGARTDVDPDSLGRLRPAFLRLVIEADPLVAGQAAEVLGHLGVDEVVVDHLLQLAEADEADTEELAAAVIGALGNLLGAYGAASEDHRAADIAALLHRVAAGTDAVLAAHAIRGLAAAGYQVESLTDAVSHRIMLRGLIDLSDHWTVGGHYDQAIRRVVELIRRPPGLSGVEAEQCSADLVDQLLDLVLQGVEDAARTGRVGRRQISPSDSLPVLAELSLRMPAAVRVAVARRAPDLCARLIAALDGPSGWTFRRGVAVVLIVVGDGDRPVIDALLRLATDDEAVRAGVQLASRNLEQITPAGLERLLEATDDRSLVRVGFAVELMASLFEHRVLVERDRRLVLDAVDRARKRPDAHRVLVEEYDEQIRGLRTLRETCNEVLLRMSGRTVATGETDARHRHGAFSFTVPDLRGHPVTLAVADVGPASTAHALDSQTTLLAGAGTGIDTRIINAVRSASDVAFAAGISFSDLLAAVLENQVVSSSGDASASDIA